MLPVEYGKRIGLTGENLGASVYLASVKLNDLRLFKRFKRLSFRACEFEKLSRRNGFKAAEHINDRGLLTRPAPFFLGKVHCVLGRNGKTRHFDRFIADAPSALVVKPQPRRKHGLYGVVHGAEKPFTHEKR